MAKFSEDVSKRYQVGSSCVKLGTSWAKMRIGWAKMDPQFPRTAGQCLGNGQQNGHTRHSSQETAYCSSPGTAGFWVVFRGSAMAKFSGVSTWYQVGPSWVKMSTSWAKMKIVPQSCWGRAGELVPKRVHATQFPGNWPGS